MKQLLGVAEHTTQKGNKSEDRVKWKQQQLLSLELITNHSILRIITNVELGDKRMSKDIHKRQASRLFVSRLTNMISQRIIRVVKERLGVAGVVCQIGVDL